MTAGAVSGAGAASAELRESEAALKVPAASVETFTRELSNLLAGGLSLSRGLGILEREASHPVARKVWTEVRSGVVGGASLADTLARFPRTFSTVYVAMVRAGEAGGFLHLVLEQIAEFRTREQELRNRVKSALVYPAVLATLAVAVLIFLLTFFIPRFSTIFSEFGGRLPALTRAIITASDFIVNHWLICLLVLVVPGVLVQRLVGGVEGKKSLERTLLRVPAFGQAVARFALVRFTRMLGTLIGAGVPLVQALRVAREALGNETLSQAVGQGIKEVEEGASLSKSFRSCPLLFPSSAIEILSVAEETGRLDKELKRLSASYESDLDRRLRMLVALMEPLLLILMASVIGTVVVGMLLPIFNLQDLIH